MIMSDCNRFFFKHSLMLPVPDLNLSVQHIQLWIEDFPEAGVSTLQGCVNPQFCQIFPKTA